MSMFRDTDVDRDKRQHQYINLRTKPIGEIKIPHTGPEAQVVMSKLFEMYGVDAIAADWNAALCVQISTIKNLQKTLLAEAQQHAGKNRESSSQYRPVQQGQDRRGRPAAKNGIERAASGKRFKRKSVDSSRPKTKR